MHHSKGGTALGILVGVAVGLALALGVAIYVAKVPTPFFNKTQTRTPEQDSAEAKKNKDWDPNAPLYGKNPVRASNAPATAASGAGGTPGGPLASTSASATTSASASRSAAADALGDLARAKTTEPFIYFVQVGAYRTGDDAEAQRARLTLSGVEAKVSEREQAGRVVFRVRVGPFETKEEAERIKDRLEANGQEAALVRVYR